MIKFYGYSKWSTVRKAKVWLEENNLENGEVELSMDLINETYKYKLKKVKGA